VEEEGRIKKLEGEWFGNVVRYQEHSEIKKKEISLRAPHAVFRIFQFGSGIAFRAAYIVYLAFRRSAPLGFHVRRPD